jgi:hypothetical protein
MEKKKENNKVILIFSEEEAWRLGKILPITAASFLKKANTAYQCYIKSPTNDNKQKSDIADKKYKLLNKIISILNE